MKNFVVLLSLLSSLSCGRHHASEDLGYLDGVCCVTRFECATTQTGCELTVSTEERGFRQSDKRDLELVFHLAERPAKVFLDGKKVKRPSDKAFEAHKTPVGWIWDAPSGSCTVRIPDTGEPVNIFVGGSN